MHAVEEKSLSLSSLSSNFLQILSLTSSFGKLMEEGRQEEERREGRVIESEEEGKREKSVKLLAGIYIYITRFGKGSFDESANALYMAARLKSRELFELSHEEKKDIEEKGREMVEWNFLRVLIFDCPAASLTISPFESRLMHLLDSIDSSHSFMVSGHEMKGEEGRRKGGEKYVKSILIIKQMFIPHMASKGRKHLEKTLEGVLLDGGEGIVLRRFNSIYCGGRSNLLYKLKVMGRRETRGEKEEKEVGGRANSHIFLDDPRSRSAACFDR